MTSRGGGWLCGVRAEALWASRGGSGDTTTREGRERSKTGKEGGGRNK